MHDILAAVERCLSRGDASALATVVTGDDNAGGPPRTRPLRRILLALAALALALASCDGTPSQGAAPVETEPPAALPITPTYFPTPVFFATPTATPAPDPIYVALIWLFHQPAHDTDAQTGLVVLPDVRLRALLSYYPAAASLRAYPALKVNASFSTVLLEQLDALAAGQRDLDFELSTRDAASLTADDRRRIVARFFDLFPAGSDSAFPRLAELRLRRGPDPAVDDAAGFSEQDLRDLQALTLAAPLPESARASPPVQALLAKGRDFTEEDKRTLALAALDVARGLAPLYRDLQDQGAVDIVAAPYAYPILPLLMDPEAQRASRAGSGQGASVFDYPGDGVEHLTRPIAAQQAMFGRPPRGLWPGLGALSAGTAEAVRQAGFAWIASGERVLARSLDEQAAGGFARDAAGLVVQADALYRPYRLEAPPGAPGGASIALVFGDEKLSGDVQTAGGAGLVERLRSIKAGLKQQGASGPHLVTLILDGERAEPAFIDTVYAALAQASASGEVVTVTLSDFLAGHAELRPLPRLATAAWANDTLRAWANNTPAADAWAYLGQARDFLDGYLSGQKMAEPSAIARAYRSALLAESADWFAAGGAGQNEARYLDATFRSWLARVYSELGAPVPDYVRIPLRRSVVARSNMPAPAILTPTVDGLVDPGEWEGAGRVDLSGVNPILDAAWLAAGEDSLFIRLDGAAELASYVGSPEAPGPFQLGVYLRLPASAEAGASRFTRVEAEGDSRAALGFEATHLAEWALDAAGTASAALYRANDNGGWSAAGDLHSAAVGQVLEIAIDRKRLEGLAPGAQIDIVVAARSGSATIVVVPDEGTIQVLVQ